ncbi:MAG: Type 1 glutamine amidotransferase-like domain-containing protein [Chloroflexi bacterium]|nr:Type 1 glutamine amidotransferase-like domain-containing protein [Chloroflexota bacterium]
MPGMLALVGAGEYLDTMRAVDERLLESIAAPQKRVVLLPTAAALEPDFRKWSDMGHRHFTAIGVEVRPLDVLTREDAMNADLAAEIAAANFVYLSGGNPAYLLQTLKDTPVWRAIRGVWEAGGVVAGCSAGAMIMGGLLRGRREPPFEWTPALGMASSVIIAPHFDRMPPARLRQILDPLPEGFILLGIDEHTAAVAGPDGWEVMGHGGVHLHEGGAARSFRHGERIPLPALAL